MDLIDIEKNRTSFSSHFITKGERILFVFNKIITTEDVKLILLEFLGTGDKTFKQAPIINFLHDILTAIPTVEIADDRNLFCHRCITAEEIAILAIDHCVMGSKISVGIRKMSIQKLVKIYGIIHI